MVHSETTYEHLRDTLCARVRAEFETLESEGRASIVVSERDESSDTGEDGAPTFCLEVRPSNPAAAMIGFYLWLEVDAEIDANIGIGSNGAWLEYAVDVNDPNSTESFLGLVVRLCDVVSSGRLSEVLELRRDGQPRAVFTKGWDRDGDVVLDALRAVGGWKRSERTVRYEPF